jgi:thiamine transport system substrate-binding protein
MIRSRLLVACVALAILAAACGSSTGTAASTGSTAAPTTVRLLTHSSFSVSKPVLAAFEKRTGIKVQVLKGGDAVEMVNKAILTRDHPEADVLYGIDNDTLTKAYGVGLFDPYTAKGLDQVPPEYQLDAQHRVTPVDHADVCVDYDAAWFKDHDVAVPQSLDDLTKPAYKGLLVTEDPTTSTPGLAFLLATVAAKGTSARGGWPVYWKALRANDVQVASSWDEAFESAFTAGGGKGTRPIVVSYATDPAYAVINADPKPTTSPIGVMDSTCFRQVELAGVLHGTKHPAAAHALVDFLLSMSFQADVPLQMYVQPVRHGVEVPAAFAKWTAQPARTLSLTPADIGAHHDEWVQQWTDIVAR